MSCQPQAVYTAPVRNYVQLGYRKSCVNGCFRPLYPGSAEALKSAVATGALRLTALLTSFGINLHATVSVIMSRKYDTWYAVK